MAAVGSRKAMGGVRPRIRSRITPPPVAVVRPKMHMPKMSMFLRSPIMAPEAAKATVPMRLTIKIKVSMVVL